MALIIDHVHVMKRPREPQNDGVWSLRPVDTGMGSEGGGLGRAQQLRLLPQTLPHASLLELCPLQ